MIDLSTLPTSTVSPRIPLGDWANSLINWMTAHWTPLFDGLAAVINGGVDGLDGLLRSLPIIVIVLVLAALALWARGWKFALVSVLGLIIIDGLNQFPPMLDTLSQILVASVLAIVLAVPLGILASRSRTASNLLRPILDFMQTLPAYVYLLPFLFLMGLGPACAVLATIIFAMPPGVRLTELGIRGVNREMIEAGESFGATPMEVLRGIQLPLALPTIMAGINQVIMLALSMVVIGSIVGAPGLGANVLSALSTLDVGPGVEAGVAVVILAIYLDRLTDAFAKGEFGLRAELAGRRRRRERAAVSRSDPARPETRTDAEATAPA